MIVMGTTMPNDQAYALPFEGRLVMINVEKSRVDGECKLIIREDPDKVMSLLMQKLRFSNPPWKRYYRLRVVLDEDAQSIQCSAIDRYGVDHYILKSLKVTGLTR